MSDPIADENTTMFRVQCIFCKDVHAIIVPTEKYKRWQAGEHVQSVFPELPADIRELMISGTCSPCWDRHMRFDDDDI